VSSGWKVNDEAHRAEEKKEIDEAKETRRVNLRTKKVFE
jgi:hypothetical protein